MSPLVKPDESDPGKVMADLLIGAGHEAALETFGRTLIWRSTFDHCADLLKLALRARLWAEHEGARDDAPNTALRLEDAPSDFPGCTEGFRIAEANFMLATVLFVSVFNTGHGERGLVAGSGRLLDPLTSQALEVIIAGAFGTVSERSAFDALRERLVAGRDGLIAHVDGSKVDMKHTPQLTSFRTASSAFDWSDARPLFDAVNALSLSARGFRAALDRRSSPGEAETNAAG